MKSLITVAIEDTYLNRIKTIYAKLRGDRSNILYSEKLKVFFFHKVKNKKRMLTLSSSINIVLGGLATIIKQNKQTKKNESHLK